MELLRGETLRERVEEGAIPQRKALEYGLQIAHGLAAAHEKGIVHRDLKPENVFVTTDGPGQDPRLRSREGRLRVDRLDEIADGRAHRAGHGDGDGRLHVAGAGPGEGGGPPLGHLLAGHDPVRDALRRPRVPRRVGGGDDGGDRAEGPARAGGNRREISDLDRANPSPLPRETSGGTLRHRTRPRVRARDGDGRTERDDAGCAGDRRETVLADARPSRALALSRRSGPDSSSAAGCARDGRSRRGRPR